MNSITRCSKRKLQVLSDSDEDTKTTDTGVNRRRQSSRIFERQHKPDFRLPSRDKVWNDIPSMKSVSKLKSLTPRKTVNDFTKVHNKYNYDDYEDSSDDESSSVETSDSDDVQKKRRHRIKNFHKRLQVQPSSSDEDSENLGKNDKAGIQIPDTLQDEQDRKDTTEVKIELGNEHSCNDMKYKFDLGKSSDSKNADLGDSDESEVISPCKRSSHGRNRSFLESADESSKQGNDGDSENGNTSQSSVSSDNPAESSKYRFANQKIKQKNLFQKFRDAQAKRKKKGD